MSRPTQRSLDEWLSWQEANHPKSWDLGLARIGAVWQAMAQGDIAEHVVIVAGTNGKGSCVRWAEALAVEHGISVATFTSPHLLDYRERIRFDGHWVDADALVDAFEFIEQKRGATTLTYFEWSALAAFYLMAQRRPQLAVLEVGLGGRLDATNILDADAAIITRIGIDHQDWLGNDVADIAREKAGVMRSGQTVVCADAHPPAALLDAAKQLQVSPWLLGKELNAKRDNGSLVVNVPGFSATLPLPALMHGEHQDGHLTAVLAVLAQWFSLSTQAVAEAVRNTAHNGRMSWYDYPLHEADWLLDVAHNADSAEVLAEYLTALKPTYQRILCLCGMLVDKAHQEVFSCLQVVVDEWVLCGLGGARGCRAEHLADAAQAVGIKASEMNLCPDTKQALAYMVKRAGAGDLVVVMGSFVTVAEVLKGLEDDE